jgi:hypothetical protein
MRFAWISFSRFEQLKILASGRTIEVKEDICINKEQGAGLGIEALGDGSLTPREPMPGEPGGSTVDWNSSEFLSRCYGMCYTLADLLNPLSAVDPLP